MQDNSIDMNLSVKYFIITQHSRIIFFDFFFVVTGGDSGEVDLLLLLVNALRFNALQITALRAIAMVAFGFHTAKLVVACVAATLSLILRMVLRRIRNSYVWGYCEMSVRDTGRML